MDIAGRVGGVVRQVAFSAGLGVVVLAIALAGLGFLTAALYVYMGQHFGPAPAAAFTGLALLVLAILAGLIGGVVIKKLQKPQPSLLAEFGGTVGLATRLIGIAVRRDPKKAMILAAVSGAIAEYVLSDNRK